jgi:hypothetical protein
MTQEITKMHVGQSSLLFGGSSTQRQTPNLKKHVSPFCIVLTIPWLHNTLTFATPIDSSGESALTLDQVASHCGPSGFYAFEGTSLCVIS